MSFTYIRRAAVALALIATAGCMVKNTEPPPLSGPSGLALLLTLNAIPDSISQDGGSQSSVKVTAIGPDGKPVSALPIRVDMMVNGVAQDYGTLSARSIVTNSDGVATVVYTAPPSPPNGVFGTCNSLPGNCVSIVATATATNFNTANPQQVQIRLVPTGIILPPTQTPTPSFAVIPASPAANAPAQFDASASCGGPLVSGSCPASAPSITSHSWNFGDGQTGTGQTVSHSFALQQTYTVTLTVTNALGASASKPQVVTVGGGSLPSPSFTFSPAQPAVGEPVFFSGLASTAGQGHTIASYRWNFGDGTSASGSNVSHPFTTAGGYVVQLTVTDDAGVSVTSAGTTVTVGNPVAPTANFTFSPAAPAVGESVIFDYRLSTTAQGQGIVALDWNFGDNTAPVHCPGSAACAPDGITTHVFQRVGTFNVALVITDAAGRTGTRSTPVTVSAGGAATPTPSFTFSPTAPGVNDSVFFNASASTAGPGRSIVSYRWTFGDGATGTGVTVTHAYSSTGTYSVQLTVTDESGLSATSAATSVTVGSPPTPTAKFTFSPSTPAASQSVVFDASTSTPSGQGQPITDYAWSFGDGTPIVHTSAKTIGHTFGFGGIFNVNLTVTDGAGRVGAVSATITVSSGDATLPTVIITATPSPAPVNTEVSFVANVTNPGTGASSITNYQWDFGDGTKQFSSNVSNVGYTYRVKGTYTVKVTVTNNIGRQGSTTFTIVVQ